jgi:hypothetical protein
MEEVQPLPTPTPGRLLRSINQANQEENEKKSWGNNKNFTLKRKMFLLVFTTEINITK